MESRVAQSRDIHLGSLRLQRLNLLPLARMRRKRGEKGQGVYRPHPDPTKRFRDFFPRPLGRASRRRRQSGGHCVQKNGVFSPFPFLGPGFRSDEIAPQTVSPPPPPHGRKARNPNAKRKEGMRKKRERDSFVVPFFCVTQMESPLEVVETMACFSLSQQADKNSSFCLHLFRGELCNRFPLFSPLYARHFQSSPSQRRYHETRWGGRSEIGKWASKNNKGFLLCAHSVIRRGRRLSTRTSPTLGTGRGNIA